MIPMSDELKKLSNRQRKARAREIWLEHGGDITMEALGKMINLSRQTLMRARRSEGWDADLDEAREPARIKAAEVVRDSVEVAFSRHIRVLQQLDQKIEEKLKGKLTVTELTNLSRAVSTVIQSSRLLNGLSTNNTSIKGEMAVDSAEQRHLDDTFNRAVEKIMQTGDEEGQAALVAMVEAQQQLVAVLDAE